MNDNKKTNYETKMNDEEQYNISLSDIIEFFIPVIFAIGLVGLIIYSTMSSAKYNREYDKDLGIAIEERAKYQVEFNWDSNLNENLKLNEQMFKDIQIKTDEKYETMKRFYHDEIKTHRFAYIDNISKEQFTELTEEEYINLMINKVKPLESMSYNYEWLEVRFEDGTKIAYYGDGEVGYYKLDSVREDFQTIGKIYYETNSNNSIYNVRYVPIAVEGEPGYSD